MPQLARVPAIGDDVSDLMRSGTMPAIGEDVTTLMTPFPPPRPAPRLATPLPAAATRGMLPPSTVAGDPEPFNAPRLVTVAAQPPLRQTRGVTRRQATARTADIVLPAAA